MNNSIKILILFLVALSGISFIGGILAAGYYSNWAPGAPIPEKMPSFLTNLVITVGGVLGTNFGAVVGLSMSKSQAFTEVSFFQPFGVQKNESVKIKGNERLQVIAAWGYVIGLVMAVIFWLGTNFSEEPGTVVLLLPELSKTLIGVIVGALAVALGLQE